MRQLVDCLDTRFAELHRRTVELAGRVPDGRLYWQPLETDALFPVNSCGEYILRSAAAVEQTFGGITARLWDDPFEWTLPEALPTTRHVVGYLAEVNDVRVRGFSFFVSDDDLGRMIPAPEKLRSLFEILIDALLKAEHFHGRAAAVARLFPERVLPRS